MPEQNARIAPNGSPRRWKTAGCAAALLLSACHGEENADKGSATAPQFGTQLAAQQALGATSAALSATALPESLSYELTLGNSSVELLLRRVAPSLATNYRSYDLSATGLLVEQAAQLPNCSYRGRAIATDANGQQTTGFVSVSLCSSATGFPLGQALSGVLVLDGQLWDLGPVANASLTATGIEHSLRASRRGGEIAPLLSYNSTATIVSGPLAELPLTPYPFQEFREGTPQETKYIELVLVNDSARVAQRGSQVQADGLALIEAANALLEDSNLSPRVRLVLTAQVNFTTDPFPLFSNNLDGNGDPIELSDGEEIDHSLLLDSFLQWANTASLPAHDEHLLLSGQDFFQNSAGLAPVGAACLAGQSGFLVQADSATPEGGLGFSVLSTVHELGHTLGMDHDPNSATCPNFDHIMSAVGCANCPIGGIDFSPCSQQDFTTYLASANYQISRCADNLPLAPTTASCGDGVVSEGESCDCGSADCTGIDPCCDGASCELVAGAACSDYNDGCCAECQLVDTSAEVVCRAQRSECDTAEVCTGLTAQCPDDTFLAAGGDCQDSAANDGVCFFGNCLSRTPQCQQVGNLLAQQDANFDGALSAPSASCNAGCESVICEGAPGSGVTCLQIGGTVVADGVACGDGRQCVQGDCVALVDQCPENDNKTSPGQCGCDQSEEDSDSDGTLDCFDACPDDSEKQIAGACGCGTAETDDDNDGTPNCLDSCPDDPLKVATGLCGCGLSDEDDDKDGVPNCADECPATPGQAVAGACGCGLSDRDSDSDGVADCNDACPDDANASTRPCPEPELDDGSATMGNDNGNNDGRGNGADEPSEDGVVLRVETESGFFCSLSGSPQGGSRHNSQRPAIWLGVLAGLLVLRKRRSV